MRAGGRAAGRKLIVRLAGVNPVLGKIIIPLFDPYPKAQHNF